jgi:hypothetical protein
MEVCFLLPASTMLSWIEQIFAGALALRLVGTISLGRFIVLNWGFLLADRMLIESGTCVGLN